jgi:hypothetical protein
VSDKYSQLGIMDGMQEGSIFGGNNVPRGTLLWNGYAQYLVCCGKLFLVGTGGGGCAPWVKARNGGSDGSGIFSILM